MQHQTIVLFDALHNLTVNFKAMQKDSGPNDAAMTTLRVLGEVRQMGHTILCMDMPPYSRTKIYAEYKARRDREPEFGAIVKWFLERAVKDGYHVAQCAGAESDDVIATLARQFVERGCKDVRIVSEDKDLTQCLVHPGVRIFVYRGKGEWEVRDADYVRKRYSADEGRAVVEPKDMALYLALVGDASDSVPGINGIGGVTAAKFIHHYKNPAGIAVALSAAVEAAKAPGAKPLASIWKKYAEGMAELPRWLQLTRLHDDVHVVPGIEALLRVKEIQPLVDDAVDTELLEPGSDLDEPDWDAVAEETLAEQERALMASALPVGKPLVLEPERDPAERRAAMAAEGDKLFGAHDPSKMVIGADPNAGAILAQKAEERAARNQGPTKAGKQIEDAISRPRAATTPDVDTRTPVDAAASSTGGADPKAAPAAPADSSGSAPSQGTAAAVSEPPSPQKPKPDAAPRVELVERADIVRVPAPSWALATQPQTASEMMAIAKTVINSRYFSQFGTPAGVFAVMQLGRELGLGMMEALEAFHIVKDRPFPKATTLQALAERHPMCVWILVTESDSEHATCKSVHREAGPLSYNYTIDDARREGLTTGSNRHNWETKPRNMLEARAKSRAARLWYPGAVMGLHSFEEQE